MIFFFQFYTKFDNLMGKTVCNFTRMINQNAKWKVNWRLKDGTNQQNKLFSALMEPIASFIMNC